MRIHAAFLVALAALGCSASPSADPCAPEPTVEHFTLRTPGQFYQVALEGDRIFGPHLDITRYDEAYRGLLHRHIVDLRLRDNVLEGTIGNARTELYIHEYPDGFVVRGLYGGRLGQLHMRADKLVGRMGWRAFVLHRAPDDPLVYQSEANAGQVTARGPTELTLPPSFRDRPTEEKAALLALFLGR
jgi:hypothetical protein